MSWRLSFLLIGCLLLVSALPASQADEGGVGSTDSDPSSNEQEGSDGSTAGGASGGLRESGEKFQFQAEVTRLMDIIINSLYSNKDIFLRELISNASDALDKIRFLSLTDKSQLGDGEDVNLEVRISIDRDGKLIRIRDRGIGMTKDELVKNLGTIAKSGTSAFLEQMQKGGDVNLIGQFGVGFYSVFLVADHVEVVTKHNDDEQYIWESRADGNFAITEDPEGSVSGEGGLGRGTVLRIHVKDEAQEYLQETKLRQLIAKYSEFINFPIYMHVQKEKEVPVDEEDEDEGVADMDEDVEDEDEEESNDGVEDEDGEGDEEEEEEEVKTEKKKFWEWELLNSQKAIWLRPPSDVSDEEYEKFYKALSKNEWESPMSWAHFKAEGDVEFRSIVYVPPKAPFDFYDNFYQRALGLKLYVRRVFISDEVEELLPRYLGFILGLVDSDTLPLNVSREMLQQHTSLRTIKKKLVRKILDMIRKLSEADNRHREDVRDEKEGSTDVEDEVEEERSAEEKESDKKDAEKYKEFWSEYGKAIKLGIIEDNANRQRLAKLLRFQTSKSGGELVSLDEYITRMKPDQKHIYYLAGASVDEVASSPFVEKLIAKGYEVIYFTDSVDEYMMQSLLEYEDSKFQNISKEDLELGDMAQLKKAKQEFKPLTSWWKKALASHSEAKNLEGVRVSDRLEQTPCVVVTSKYGWSANMQKIMAAQALGDASRQAYMKGKTWLEINYRHPLIREMLAKVEADSEDNDTQQVATLLYETALMESGFVLEEPKPFAQRVYHLLKAQLGMEGELTDLSPEELDTDEDDDGKESESAGDMHVSNDDLDATGTRVEL